jgi:hypothetical protein
MKRALALVLILHIIFAQSASALFGSECKKPKASYTQEMKNYEKFKKMAYTFSAADKATYEKQQSISREKDYQNCLKQKLLTSSECKAMKGLSAQLNNSSRLVRPEYEKSMSLSLDTAYRIVLNNQKCFDPTLVVKAQRALGK